jgi:hypothetical protein
MPNEKWGVAKVKGIEAEQFFIFLMGTEGSKGPITRTSDFLSEDELRTELANRGITEPEIVCDRQSSVAPKHSRSKTTELVCCAACCGAA